MSNDNWDNSEQDWKEQDGGFFGTRAMSPEARNILKHMKSMGITKGEAEGVTVKPVPMPNVDSDPMPLFRLPSNQDENQYLTPGAKKIAWHLDQMGITDNGPVEPAFKMEPVPMPKALNIGNQPTEPAILDETAQYFNQVKQAFEKRKAETAEKIAYYNQHGWPTYDSGTDSNLPAPPVEPVQNALLVKRDDMRDRPDDIYLARNNIVDPLSLTDIGSRLAENEQGSDPAYDPARRIQEEADSQAEETKAREAQKQAKAEKPAPKAEKEGFNQKNNAAASAKASFPIQVNSEAIRDFEGGQKYTPNVPLDSSGATVGSGNDLAQHTRTELDKMGVSKELLDKLAPFLSPKHGEKGPLGKAAKALLEADKQKEKPSFTLSRAEADELDHAIYKTKLRQAGNHYNNLTKDDPDATKFHELSPKIQTIIASRFFHRGTKWPGSHPELMNTIKRDHETSAEKEAEVAQVLEDEMGVRNQKKETAWYGTRLGKELRYLKLPEE